MGYTIWTSSVTVAYKTRPARLSAAGGFVFATREDGRLDEYTEERGGWFEPVDIATGLTMEQAENLLHEFVELAALPGEGDLPFAKGYEPKTRNSLAAKLALSRKADVVVKSYWITADAASTDDAAKIAQYLA